MKLLDILDPNNMSMNMQKIELGQYLTAKKKESLVR
jgi:hypothetical protein